MSQPTILISFPFVEGGGAWHIPLGGACVEALKGLGFNVGMFNPVVEARRGFGWKMLERSAVLGGRLIGRSKADTKSRLPWLEEAQRFDGLIAKAHALRPDYLLVISTFTYPQRVLEALRQEAGVKKTIGWCVEGPTWIGKPNREAELYDHYFCIHRSGITNPKIRYLPALGFDASAYSRLEGQAKMHDLVFVGREKKRRVEWLMPLRELSLKVYGPEWGHTPLAAHQVSEGVFGHELNLLYNQAKIVLNVSAWENGGTGGSALNLRIFDVPATGSLLLTDYAPGIEEYLEPDKEVVVAHSPAEMRDKALYYLAHDAERERIARAGWEKVRQLETYPQKMRRLLEACNIPLPG
ncbi:glycosyltransferase [Uliginosibacterium sp. 31-16]|uniref:CgeB family protein n=1 Tax=Uliginosibacterium sp. 31-16 TaxID=3068315 RepID=UPI00273F44A9|nr:glycosyltransferase [Uliginosibacterium sp. 31-16]MDP5238428.1 glycosyltransferase [Uliginosibacterium sp. 31-16]